MKNKQLYKNFVCIVLTFILLIFAVISGGFTASAFADTDKHLGVMDDLSKDKDFSQESYPKKSDDFSLQVFQIAEGTKGELFIYVYKPCGVKNLFNATQLNMSLSDKLGREYESSEDKEYSKLYDLTLIDESGVFGKYKVDGFVVKKAEKRYYNITSIYRLWVKGIDKETGTDNTANAVSFPVGKLFCADTIDGQIVYDGVGVDVVQIFNPYAGFLRISNGYFFGTWYSDVTDCFFVGFATDTEIDKLKSVTLSYIRYDCSHQVTGWWHEDDRIPNPVVDTIYSDKKLSNNPIGFGGIRYEFPMIMTTDKFKSTFSLSDSAINGLKDTEWVVNFLAAPNVSQGDGAHHTWTEVEEVTVLELEFVKGLITYRMGAVSDKVTGLDVPVGGEKPKPGILGALDGLPWWAWLIIAVVILLVLLIVLKILSVFFPVISVIVNPIFSAIWWVICLPFRGIKALVQKIRGD